VFVEWTPERRAEHAEKTRQGMVRARERRRLRIGQIDGYRRSGEVAPALLPLLRAEAAEAQQLVADLGGDLSGAQLALPFRRSAFNEFRGGFSRAKISRRTRLAQASRRFPSRRSRRSCGRPELSTRGSKQRLYAKGWRTTFADHAELSCGARPLAVGW